mgnify:CR=1 FL=1
MPRRFENREEALAWICKNQLGRRNLTPEQKKFLIGKQYSVEHRKPGGNGNNQHTAAAKKTAPEELCQFDTIPPTSAEASIRKQIAERNNVRESYVVRSEKFIRGVEIMEQMMPGTKEKILSGQFKVRDIVCGFSQGVSGRAHPVFAFSPLVRGSQPYFSNILPVRRSGSSLHSQAGHCR